VPGSGRADPGNPVLTSVRVNEGTPNIYSVSLTPDIDHSIIDVGFHYQRNCDLDRQVRGRLTNFTTWTAGADAGADDLLTAAAAAHGRVVNGNLEDRDGAVFDNTRHTVHEVQYVKGDFGSWRLYLHNWQTGTPANLPVTTHGWSTAFANPAATTIISPAGKPATLTTLFVPSKGAAPGEAGQLIYYREYVTLPAPTTGLSATYYENLDFTGSTLVRTDPRIDVDLGTGPPSANSGSDGPAGARRPHRDVHLLHADRRPTGLTTGRALRWSRRRPGRSVAGRGCRSAGWWRRRGARGGVGPAGCLLALPGWWPRCAGGGGA